MRSSSTSRALGFAIALLVANAGASRAEAQQPARGFAVERLYPSAPGGGWFVMDALDMRGALGGAMSLAAGYAHNPLRVRATDGSQHLSVVSASASADLGLAVTYDRWRLYLNFGIPLVVKGQSGTVGDYQLSAPGVDPASNPDTLSDARVGFDTRLLGDAKGSFRLGAGAQLVVPSGNRPEYDTDATYRVMGRILFAGDVGMFTYAGQLGVHVRPLNDAPAPGSPQGSELLFGVAAGAKLPVCRDGTTALVVGPEIYGATAFRSFFNSNTTALEGLLTGRLEGTADDGPQLRVKVGTGAGINQHFGAPDWRLVFAVEIFNHRSDRDRDGVSDSRDACPNVPGLKDSDPNRNGCPSDGDGDGIPDVEDACPHATGPNTADAKTTGCPLAAPAD